MNIFIYYSIFIIFVYEYNKNNDPNGVQFITKTGSGGKKFLELHFLFLGFAERNLVGLYYLSNK